MKKFVKLDGKKVELPEFKEKQDHGLRGELDGQVISLAPSVKKETEGKYEIDEKGTFFVPLRKNEQVLYFTGATYERGGETIRETLVVKYLRQVPRRQGFVVVQIGEAELEVEQEKVRRINSAKNKKQSNRMLKIECFNMEDINDPCNYRLRGSYTQFKRGIPNCPLCGKTMVLVDAETERAEMGGKFGYLETEAERVAARKGWAERQRASDIARGFVDDKNKLTQSQIVQVMPKPTGGSWDDLADDVPVSISEKGKK